MDLLPEAQGAGWGRILVAQLCGLLRACGVRGVHASVPTENPGALSFYPRVSFVSIDGDERSETFGRTLTDLTWPDLTWLHPTRRAISRDEWRIMPPRRNLSPRLTTWWMDSGHMW
ncbi:GNAT family N-acetyltransferase [Microbacterium sp. NPDC089318]